MRGSAGADAASVCRRSFLFLVDPPQSIELGQHLLGGDHEVGHELLAEPQISFVLAAISQLVPMREHAPHLGAESERRSVPPDYRVERASSSPWIQIFGCSSTRSTNEFFSLRSVVSACRLYT